MGISEKDKSLLQSAGALVAAVGVAWMTVELALKPFLSQARKALGKSDATRDPDNDEVTVVDKAEPPPPSTKPDDAAAPATTTSTSAPAVEA